MRSNTFHDRGIEEVRLRLQRDETPVPSLDLGAGSAGDISTVSAIAKRSLKRPKHARALSALARHIGSEDALELGTSLGITTAYLSKEVERIITVEGNPAIARVASEVWSELGKTNIQSIVGGFDERWNAIASNGKKYDLIFIDGNHRGEALQRYVVAGLHLLNPNGVIVCDDIHWSADMECAWNAICQMECWTLQVDTFEWGFLTQNPSLKREHVRVRF